jgi:hypothetical protein
VTSPRDEDLAPGDRDPGQLGADPIPEPAAPALDPERPTPRYAARPLRDSSSTSRSWGYLGVIGAVLVAAAVILVGPNLLTPAATPGPTVAPSFDAHVLATSVGTYAISLDYQAEAFIVSRADGGSAELGRGVIAPDQPQLQSGAPLNGAYAWTLSCPSATANQAVRFVFGALAPADDPQYVGPAASWTVASDGLFLIVLNPGFVDPGAEIRLATRSTSIGVDVSSFAGASTSGTPEPSGCRLE